MIKIRLEGEKEEIEQAASLLSVTFKILNESQPYPNRGNSLYYRVYVDCAPRTVLADPDVVNTLKASVSEEESKRRSRSFYLE